MHTHTHTHIYTHITHSHIHTYTPYIYTHSHTYTHSQAHLCTLTHTHTLTYIYIYIHTYTYTDIHICIHTYTHIHSDHIHTHTLTHTCTHIHTHIYTFTISFMHTHTFTHSYTHTEYTHIYTHTHTVSHHCSCSSCLLKGQVPSVFSRAFFSSNSSLPPRLRTCTETHTSLWLGVLMLSQLPLWLGTLCPPPLGAARVKRYSSRPNAFFLCVVLTFGKGFPGEAIGITRHNETCGLLKPLSGLCDWEMKGRQVSAQEIRARRLPALAGGQLPTTRLLTH